MVRKAICLILFSILIMGCTVKWKYTESPIEPPKEVQISEKLPYTAEIRVDRSKEITHKRGDFTIIYPVGAMLDDAVKYYLKPMFIGEEYKNVILVIEAVNVESRPGKGSLVIPICVQLRAKASIYIDNIAASLGIYEQGEGCDQGTFNIPPDAPAANKAAIEAVIKLRKEIYEALTFPGKSVSAIQDFIKQNPNNLVAFVALANLSRLTKNYDEAITAAKRAIEISPKDGAAYKILGLTYKELKQYKEAINFLKKALAIDPKDTDIYSTLAQIYMIKENYSAAVDILKKASFMPQTAQDLVMAYLAMGKFDEAIEVINKMIDKYIFRGIGTSIAIEEKYPVVKSVLPAGPAERGGIAVGDKIIMINGQSTEGWDINKVTQNLRGAEGVQVNLTIERKGMDKPLAKVITREKIIQKAAAIPLGRRSLIYAANNEIEKAGQDAEKAYALDPNNIWSKRAIGLAYIFKGNKIEETLKLLSNSRSHFDRLLEALAYAKMGDLKKSAEIYSLLPEEYLVSKNVFRQFFKKAILDSLAAYKERKKETAKAFESKGKYGEALKEYAALLKVADEQEAREIRTYIGQLIRGRPYLNELSEEARRHVLRAEVSTKEGKFAEAIKEYKEALKISPFYGQLYKAVALNYAELKEYKKAIINLKIYLDLSPNAPDTRAAKDEIYKWEYMLEKEGE